MSALICGSVAYDNIMVFKDRFKNHILPDKVHMLSVSFVVPEMRMEFGGCAGNIAYNLKALGGDPLPMATVGKDFGRYGAWMDGCEISRRHVTMIENEFTAQAFIMTDMDDNQITAFHPGAMALSHINEVNEADGITIGVISPDARDGMIQHAEQFVELGVPFMFDPSQMLPILDGDDLGRFVDQATWVTVNDYEWELIAERTGRSKQQVAEQVEALVITLGSKGSEIHVGGKVLEIPAARASTTADPTGCGDAYRAGLIHGITQGMDWETTGRIASLMGTIKIEHAGTQNHRIDMDDFASRYEECFGRALPST